jgi:hypothetical protein
VQEHLVHLVGVQGTLDQQSEDRDREGGERACHVMLLLEYSTWTIGHLSYAGKWARG